MKILKWRTHKWCGAKYEGLSIGVPHQSHDVPNGHISTASLLDV